MQFGFEIVTEGAKRKRATDADDAPSQMSMRPTKMARNPSTDQKKVRRQMARQKVAATQTPEERLAELHERRLASDNGDGPPLTVIEMQELDNLERSLGLQHDASRRYASDDDYDSDDEYLSCSACGGPLELLGQLGAREVARCRDCGMTFSIPAGDDSGEDVQVESSLDVQAFFGRHPGVQPGAPATTISGTPKTYEFADDDPEWQAQHQRNLQEAGGTQPSDQTHGYSFNDDSVHPEGTDFTPKRRAATMNYEQRERQLLSAMAKATPAEAMRLDAELQGLRHRRTAAIRAEADLGFASEIVADHLTPVFTATHHTAETDWLSTDADEMSDVAPQVVQNEMVAEATIWYDRIHTAVKQDAEELTEQAMGMARRTAGRYGEHYAAAAQAFLDHVAFMQRRAFESGDVSEEAWDGTLVGPTSASPEPAPVVMSSRFTPNAMQYAASLGSHEALDHELLFEADVVADPSGQGQSTITDYDTKADQDPWLSEDWEGNEPDEVPSDRAPLIEENKDGSNSERNQEVHSSRHTAILLGELSDRPGEATCPNPDCENHGVGFVHDDFSSESDGDDETVECPDCDTPLVWEDRQPKESSRHTAGNPFAPGSRNWFEYEDPNGDFKNDSGRGPTSGVPEDLFPGGGIPLHGDLTPEQQAWMNKGRRKRSSWQALAAQAGMSTDAIARIAATAAQHGVTADQMPGLLAQAGIHIESALTCDMTKGCTGDVTHVDDQGYAYCARHAAQRSGGGNRVRKLTPKEKKTLEGGGVISYSSVHTADGYKPIADESGQAQSGLPQAETLGEPMWPWELPESIKDRMSDQGAAAVADAKNPNDHSKQSAFRARIQSNLKGTR